MSVWAQQKSSTKDHKLNLKWVGKLLFVATHTHSPRTTSQERCVYTLKEKRVGERREGRQGGS